MQTPRPYPKKVAWTVACICFVPAILNLLGMDFGTTHLPLSELALAGLPPSEVQSQILFALRGAFVHSLLEWTAFCIALVTVIIAFIHYFMRRDVTTPIVGTAMFFSGMLDAFHTLASNGAISEVMKLEDFIPFTWTISRMFNALILVAGTAPFVLRSRRRLPEEERSHALRYLLLVGILFGLCAYAIIHICATLPIPTMISTDFPHLPRRFDLIPLALYLLTAGIILPRFYRRHPSLFARGLQISVIPHAAAQMYAAFGSHHLYDNGFNLASVMKAFAYLVPLIGLLIDYSHAYQFEAALLTTQQQMQLARDLQERLLPQSAPQIPGYEIAGLSRFAESIGGDYFDYLTMPDGSCGLVVADVSGHDPGASMLMANTRAYLRVLCRSRQDVSGILYELNQYLVEDTRGLRFVSAFLGRLDPAGHRLEYDTAGHPGYLIHADGTLTTLQSSAPPLAILDNRSDQGRWSANLVSGDMIFLVTDGLCEAADARGEQFSLERCVEHLTCYRHRPASEILDSLYTAVRGHCEPLRPVDDVTALLVKVL